MTTVVVLGASGFLGRHICEAVGSTLGTHVVIGVGRRPPSDRPAGIDRWRTMDLAAASVDDHLRLYKEEDPQVVINCVGCTVGGVEDMMAANVVMVDTLVTALTQLGSIRLVHLGSAAEYGRQPVGLPIAESAIPDPVSHYGRTKLASTRRIVSATAAGGVDATVLRVFNPVGAGAPANSLPGRVAAAIREAVAGGLDAVQLGPLDASRDFVAVTDVARAAVRAAETPGLPPLLNIGSGHATLSRTLVLELVRLAGFGGAVIEADSGSARSAAVDWQAADTTLLRQHLQGGANTPLADSLRQLWESAA